MVKTLRSLLVSMLFLTTGMSLSAQSFLEFLQADFSFNRGALADESNNALDAVGFDITSATGLEGTINGAYQFNGISSYMDCGTEDRNISDQLTLSTWIKTTSTDVERQMVASKYYFAVDRGYYISMFNEIAAVGGRDGSGELIELIGQGIKINDGLWHHLVLTIDKNNWKLYVDCQLVDDLVTNTTNPDFTLPHPLTIGKTSVITGDGRILFFDGAIDNVKLFNIALNEEQLAELSQFSCPDCTSNTDHGLVAYYRLDGDGIDDSGNILHGTVAGAAPTTDAGGIANAAMYFDGTDDYILVANADRLNFGVGTFAVSFWVLVEEPSTGPQMIIQKGQSGDVKVNPGFWVGFDDHEMEDQLRGNLTDGFPPDSSIGTSDSIFSDKSWHHVVYQRSDTHLERWVDNQLVASQADQNYRNVTGTGDLIIGAQNPWDIGGLIPSIHNHFQGSLDEIRIYDKALCADAIEKLSSSVNQVRTIPQEIGKIGLGPNPTVGLVQIQMAFNDITRVNLSLYDVHGREYWQQKWQGQNETIEKHLDDLPAGIYILRCFLPEYQAFQSFEVIKN